MRFDRRLLWIPALFLQCLVLAILFPDSVEQDGGDHFLRARWAWKDPVRFVGHWEKPLFTFLYSIPAQLGYLPARLFTSLLWCAAAWYAYRLCVLWEFRRAWLAFPFTALQPTALLISFDTMTEPLFGLLLAAAVYERAAGRPWRAALLVSLLPLLRAEGFFVAIFWGFLMLADPRIDRRFLLRWPKTLMLLLGVAAWWIAAWPITGDPVWVVTRWMYKGRDVLGHGSWDWFYRVPFRLAGPAILPLVLTGLIRECAAGRRLIPLLCVCFWALQCVLWMFGLFLTGGYARYFVAISPLLAVGAVSAVDAIETRHAMLRPVLGPILAASAWIFGLHYLDRQRALHQGPPIREAWRDYRENPVTYRRFVWSSAYQAILFDEGREANSLPSFVSREENLRHLRELGPGTLVFWDSEVGWSFYRLRPADWEEAGYRRLYFRKHQLRGYVSGLREEFEVAIYYLDP